MKHMQRSWIILFFSIMLLSDLSRAEAPRILQHAEGDLSSSFGDWPVFVLVGGVITTSFLLPLDDDVENYFSKHQFSKKLDDNVNWIADPYVLGTASVVVYATSWLSENEEFKRTSETMFEALFFNAVMVEGLKYTFRRSRPDGGSYGFPSGHTSAMFTIASVFQSMQGWRFGLPAYATAGIVGFSRIDGRNHHLSDVVFGAAMGSFVGWGTSLFHKKEDTRLLISPILDQTRGVMITYQF